MKLKLFLFLFLNIFVKLYSFSSNPDEGMWLPMFLERLNYTDMQKMGLKLTPSELYSINNSSLKDAIVMLNGGECTGEIISNEGLLLTNHHCGFDNIQSHSSVEHDYLTDGFWAKSKRDELANPDYTAAFLIRMEDVTDVFNNKLSLTLSEADRKEQIKEISDSLITEASDSGKYEVKVKDFFEGNEFYMFVYLVYKDVRLVGAPPSAIGKFGGDTDNWMWPRQTGDFSMFRIYTAPDGSPAEYSEKNIPLTPKHHLPISIKGVENNDFSMIWGYPGTTDRFLSSFGVQLATETINPTIVNIRDKKLEIIRDAMNSSKKIKIQYASKYASTANYWKYYIGQTRGLKRLQVYEKKKELEKQFSEWVATDSARRAAYGTTLMRLSSGYNEIKPYQLAMTYFNETVFEGPEIILIAYYSSELYNALKYGDFGKEMIESEAEKYQKKYTDSYFKNLDVPTDKKLFIELIGMFRKNVPIEFQPDLFAVIDKKYKGSLEKYADYLYANSMFADKIKFDAFLKKPTFDAINKDPGFFCMLSFIQAYLKLDENLSVLDNRINRGYRIFVDGLRKMNSNKTYYPNANSTMRVTYGKVCDYFPADAVQYEYYTTTKGILEKEDSTNDEFIVPKRLIELCNKKDFGQYADKSGEMRVAFITNNDITGGNSGSPVINAEGQLIGVAFDGNWEAMSGDIAYETQYQRTICVDIRYVLFIIDKYARATNLIQEMTIVK